MSGKFWEETHLEDMTKEEWESLCDHCGLCCLHKLIDERDEVIEYTSVVCNHLKLDTCQCTVYDMRNEKRPDCLPITQTEIAMPGLLPATCAYLLLYNGKELPEWHPLLTGNKNSAVETENSVKELAIPQAQVDMDDIEDYILDKTIN